MSSKSLQSEESHFAMDHATINDAQEMLQLNYNIYPEEWHVPPDYVRNVLIKNSEVYRVLRASAGIKGIYSLFPLLKEDYDGLLNGALKEENIFDYIVDYDTPKKVCLYLISIIVDIHDVRRKQYTRALIQDIPAQLKNILNKGIKIEEVGAFAISDDGNKILPKIGFKHYDENLKENSNLYPIYRATVTDIIYATKL